MSRIIIQLNDESRYNFLIELLRSLSFVQILPQGPAAEQEVDIEDMGVEVSDDFEPIVYADDDAGWAAMARDREREAAAQQWSDGTIDGVQ